MDLQFERGDFENPRGHAIVYFRDSETGDSVSATYVVILPVSVEMAKYVPPFLAGQVESMGAADFSAFALPPAPERAGNLDELMQVAEYRDDDVIFGGVGDLNDAAELLNVVGEIVADYAGRYREKTDQLTSAAIGSAGEPGPRPGLDEVVYELMNESDRLAEITTLIGRLRYAVEGGDLADAARIEAEMRAVASRLPENRRAERLVQLAGDPSPEAARVARLYLDRAYGLLREDYLRVKHLDERIAEAETDLGT